LRFDLLLVELDLELLYLGVFVGEITAEAGHLHLVVRVQLLDLPFVVFSDLFDH